MTPTYPSAETLLDEAVEQAGTTNLATSDFGPGDFREGLEVLLDSLRRDGDLSAARGGGSRRTTSAVGW